MLLKPLTFPDADRIVQFLYPNSLLNNITSIPEFHFYQRQTGPEFDTEMVREIVGIVGDTHNTGLGQVPDPMMIVPVAQVPDPYTAVYDDAQPLIWVARTHGDPYKVIAVVTEQLRLANGGFPVAHIRTMDEVMGRSTARASFNMLLLTISVKVLRERWKP